MAKYIVFPTRVWPLVVATLRRQHQWQTRELERAISGALDLLDADEPDLDLDAIRAQLREAHGFITPNPQNPGRWGNDVSVAEMYAVPAAIVDNTDELTAVQQAVLKEVGATTGYAVEPRRRAAEVPDEGVAHQRGIAEEAGMLHGMRAAPHL